jgi:hypothetical protein
MEEIERRKNAAIAAIKEAFGTEEDEYGATLFVSHHLEEIDEDYWQSHLGSPNPEPKQVLDILVLQSQWGDANSDGMDTLDFTLPGDVTDYLISVSFDGAGNVEEITMES